ncbi:MAG: hypothetical protein QOH06_80 [Acidobacteriota bacterium]|jgi:hypothetical protein|nr:hypothetical protein [Acidobacteriota bacterium]
MYRLCSLCLLLLVLILPAAPALAVPGSTDRVPAASLLVPFFETGINSTTHPQDTLLVATNRQTGSQIIHYHVWDIDGNATGLNGNVTLSAHASWDAAMRDLLNAADPAVRTQLTQGPFYRGFVTIDAVTATTGLAPTESTFPFSDANVLEGFIYYTRLSQGSANGLAMVALEAVPDAVDSFLQGFYSGGDTREEIDPAGRRCAARLTNGGECSDIDGPLARIDMRVFRSAALSGSSRGVVFTWVPGQAGGPSAICDEPVNACSPNLAFQQYDQAGNAVGSGTIRLDHVVNVIEDSNLQGDQSGWISIANLPNIRTDLQVYGFSMNSANPSGNPNLTWDAIFEAYIATD